MKTMTALALSVILGWLPVASPAAQSWAAGGPHQDAVWQFVENRGQWDPAVLFSARRADQRLWLEADAITIERSGRSVRLLFEGASASVAVEGLDPLRTRYNFLPGAAEEHRKSVPAFERIRYRNLHPGVGLEVYTNKRGQLEYDLEMEAGAWPGFIRCEGADRLEVTEDGSLQIHVGGETLVQGAPKAFSQGCAVECQIALAGDDVFYFDSGPGSEPIVIDPTLEWSTYLGGDGDDAVADIEVDPQTGDLIVLGITEAWDFPVTSNAYQRSLAGHLDVFIARLTEGGDRIAATYFGGSLTDRAWDLEIHEDGFAVAGSSSSPDFYVSSDAYDTQNDSDGDGFLAIINPALDRILYSTFFGGSTWDAIFQVRFRDRSRAVLFGLTHSTDLPTTPGAFERTFGGIRDTFVAELDMQQRTLVLGTYIGGSADDFPRDLELDDAGNILVVGDTESLDFPIAGPSFQPVFGGSRFDGYISVLHSSGSHLLYSSYLGGSDWDAASALEVFPEGLLIGGLTLSGNFPTTPGAFQTSWSGHQDAFLLLLAPPGDHLAWSTLFGGDGGEYLQDLIIGPDGSLVFTGSTYWGDTPITPNAYDSDYDGPSSRRFLYDIYLARLSRDGRTLLYSTYLGGSESDSPSALAFARDGQVFLGGSTQSLDFPTTPGAFQGQHGGDYTDGILAKLSVGPWLETKGTPKPGAGFGYVVTSAPGGDSRAIAQVLLSTSNQGRLSVPGGLNLPLVRDGLTDLGLRWTALLTAPVDSIGRAETPMFPFPPVAAGLQVYSAAIVWEPMTGNVLAVSGDIDFVTE